MIQHDYELIVTRLWTLLHKLSHKLWHTRRQQNIWPELFKSRLALTGYKLKEVLIFLYRNSFHCLWMCSLKLFKHKTERQTVIKRQLYWNVTKLKLKFSLILGWFCRVLSNSTLLFSYVPLNSANCWQFKLSFISSPHPPHPLKMLFNVKFNTSQVEKLEYLFHNNCITFHEEEKPHPVYVPEVCERVQGKLICIVACG